MIGGAVGLFALGAVVGLTLAVMHFRERPLPLGLALLHGALGAAGLVTLGWAVYKEGAGWSARGAVPLVLFLVAALGGFALFSYHLRGRRHPTGLIVVHALVAVTAFGLLLAGLFA